MKELPLYEIVIDGEGDSEVSAVALVDMPAIKKDFIAFSEADKKVTLNIEFAETDEKERKVFGPLMLADTPIYRQMDGEEFYVVFTKDTIDTMAQKFFEKGFQSSVNLMHDPLQTVDAVTMFQSWIVDKEKGISPMKGFEDAPDGSWFGGFKVNNEEVWNKIQSGEVKGFSIEGMFGLKKIEMKKDLLSEIKQIIQSYENCQTIHPA
jgi:hypothetical protein